MQNRFPLRLSLSQRQVQSVRQQLEELEQELQKLAGACQLGTCGKSDTLDIPGITSRGLNVA